MQRRLKPFGQAFRVAAGPFPRRLGDPIGDFSNGGHRGRPEGSIGTAMSNRAKDGTRDSRSHSEIPSTTTACLPCRVMIDDTPLHALSTTAESFALAFRNRVPAYPPLMTILVIYGLTTIRHRHHGA
jgi:hypothetical protein